ncbi:hypothetical protein EZS27_024857 [termite gut metagenome]|uniref:HTH cro/C1-type domain-containing protein n=1 Tax=termite gut metagenome TaxID=433724 RepID=A0A5J4QVX7_9ZZZZ
MESIYDYAIQIMIKKRAERRWSQQELADYMNVSRSFLRNIESPKERARLNLFHINELAKVFQCSPKDFLPLEPL